MQVSGRGAILTSPRMSTREPSITVRLRHGTEEFLLRSGEAVLGRGAACHLRIDAREVSRRHARVWIEGATVLVEDLGSLGGTSFAGEAVTAPTRIPGQGTLLLAGCAVDVVRRRAFGEADEEPEAVASLAAVHVRGLAAAAAVGAMIDAVLRTADVTLLDAVVVPYLERAVEHARSGRLTEEEAALAAARALWAAEGSGSRRFLDAALRIYLHLRRPLPEDHLSVLERLASRVRPSENVLDLYLRIMDKAELRPGDRLLVFRVLALREQQDG
jgi:hypothetical protein